MAHKLRIKLVRSLIDQKHPLKATALGLGLRKLNQTVVLEDSHAIRGMVRKVQHLVTVEPAE